MGSNVTEPSGSPPAPRVSARRGPLALPRRDANQHPPVVRDAKMPSAIHEGLVLLFQANPGLAAILLGEVLGIELPEYSEVVEGTSSFSEMKPPEYRADSVAVLKRADGSTALTVIVEVQLDRKERKKRDWLGYSAAASRQPGSEACVLVVTPDEKVAKWAREPLRHGLISTYAPLVIGPEQVPLLRSVEEAKARPFLAILSAVAHGRDEVEQAVRAADLAREALVLLADGDVYFDLVKAMLSEPSRKAFEMLARTYEYQDQSLRESFHKGVAQGEARGEAKAILSVLEARGISVGEAEKSAIMGCTDSEQLDGMIRKALTVASASELLD